MKSTKEIPEMPKQFKRRTQAKEIELIKPELDRLTNKKLKIDTWKVTFENTYLIAGLAFLVSFSIGGILLFSYFFRQNFNSGGLTVADTLSFSQLAFGFVAVIIGMLLYGAVAAFPVTRILFFGGQKLWGVCKRKLQKTNDTLRWRAEKNVGAPMQFEWKDGQIPMLILGIFALFLLCIAAYLGPYWLKKMAGITFGAGTFFSFIAFGRFTKVYSIWKPDSLPLNMFDRWERRLSGNRHGWLIAGIFSFVLVLFQFGMIQDLSLAAIGIRKLDIAIQVKKEDFTRISRRATQLGIVINKCDSIDTEYPYISDVDVLWHKFGTLGYINLPARPFDEEIPVDVPLQLLKMEINNSAFSVITSEGKKNKCEEFFSDHLFDSSGKNLSMGGKALLRHKLNWLETLDKKLTVKIATHTTYPFAKESNESKLQANQHATLVKEFIATEFKIDTGRLSIESLEKLDQKQNCDNISDQIGRKLCEKTNRRTVISAT